jgi:hypothetical protein
MKRYFRCWVQRFTAVGLFSFLICLMVMFGPSSAVCQDSVADEIISLDVKEKPLGEVLEDISAAIDCQFSVDGKWEDYPITSSFENKPLHKALKLIFRNLNNAVIYGSERTVKIVIFNESASSEKGPGRSANVRPSRETMPSVSPSQEATAPQPEVQMSDDRSSMSDGEQSQDENTESLFDREEAGDQNQDVQEDESNEGVKKRIGDSKPIQQSSEEGENGNQAKQSEAAPTDTDASEDTEGNQETNEN